jgi:hypothetical protein
VITELYDERTIENYKILQIILRNGYCNPILLKMQCHMIQTGEIEVSLKKIVILVIGIMSHIFHLEKVTKFVDSSSNIVFSSMFQ